MTKCYVYVIKAGDKEDAPVKIGMANDYIKRIKALQTGNHKALKILTIIECDSRVHARHVESTLHKLLEARNVRGEWFKVKQSSVTGALNAFANNKDIACVESIDETQVSNDREKLKAERKKNRNVMKEYSRMSAKLSERKREAIIMREKLVELGFSGDINKLIGRH